MSSDGAGPSSSSSSSGFASSSFAPSSISEPAQQVCHTSDTLKEGGEGRGKGAWFKTTAMNTMNKGSGQNKQLLLLPISTSLSKSIVILGAVGAFAGTDITSGAIKLT